MTPEQPGRFDSAGVDRQAYEQPNCGSQKPHDPHFHVPIGGLTLNCPGKASDGKRSRRPGHDHRA